MLDVHKWKVAWSSAVGRWYYADRNTGQTSWEKPPECSIDVKAMEPPSDKMIPDEPIVTAPGWEPVWDREAQAYYFYNVFNGVWITADGRVRISDTTLTWVSGEHTDDCTIEFIGMSRIRVFYLGIRYDAHIQADGKLHLFSATGSQKVWVQEADTVERQWFNPSKKSDAQNFGFQRQKLARHHMTLDEEMQYEENKSLVGILWDPVSFKVRLDESSIGNNVDPVLHKITMAEVKENNDFYIQRTKLRIPDTHLLTHSMCSQAIIQKEVEAFVAHSPIVTASNQTVASAAAFFALDLRRSVCVLNSSSGRPDDVAKYYLEGAPGIETVHSDIEGELCRRIPNLYESLARAKARKCYPFGPCTCKDASDAQQYHTVLYTSGQEYNVDTGGNLPGLRLARYGIEHGYECYSKFTMNRAVGVVTAAAPVQRRDNAQVPAVDSTPRDQGVRDDIVDHILLKRTITSIFVAPVLHEPRLTTIVLGPWGAQDAISAERMGNMFGEAVTQPRNVTSAGEDTQSLGDVRLSVSSGRSQTDGFVKVQEATIKLGQLYHEVHFALPTRNADETVIAEAFKKGLEKAGVRLGKIDQLANGHLY